MVRVYENHFLRLTDRFPGKGGDRITKHLLECEETDLGLWVDAIRTIRNIPPGQPLKPFVFRPKPCHLPKLKSVTEAFTRHFPNNPVPTVRELIVALFFLHAEHPRPAANLANSLPNVVTAPLQPEPTPGVEAAPPPQEPEATAAAAVVDQAHPVPATRSKGGSPWLLKTLVMLISLILLILCAREVIQGRAAKNQAAAAAHQVANLSNQLRASEVRIVAVEKLAEVALSRSVELAENQKVFLQRTDAVIQSIQAEIEARGIETRRSNAAVKLKLEQCESNLRRDHDYLSLQ